MLDAVTLDQLRTFIAAADQGSFSGAGRKLRRAQSVVSKTLANLEGQFRVALFDRTRRRPTLTPQGQVLLPHAAAVVGFDVDRLKAHAKQLAGGLESELSIAVDVMFPMSTLTSAVTAFHAAFPVTPLRLYLAEGDARCGDAGDLGWPLRARGVGTASGGTTALQRRAAVRRCAGSRGRPDAPARAVHAPRFLERARKAQ